MHLIQSNQFVFPAIAIVGPREKGTVGTVIVKQAKSFGASEWEGSEPILFTDETRENDIVVESDLVPCKPHLDLIVLDRVEEIGAFEVQRNGVSTRSDLRPVQYGFESRFDENRAKFGGQFNELASRISSAEQLPESIPLPVDFRDRYFNAGRLCLQSHLSCADKVFFRRNRLLIELTIPPGPNLSFDEQYPHPDSDDIEGPAVDTFILDLFKECVVLVWRCVFPWDDRLANSVVYLR